MRRRRVANYYNQEPKVGVQFLDRRTKGCGDQIAKALRKLKSIEEIIVWCEKRNIPNISQYRESRMHIGTLRMVLGNRIRAFYRRHKFVG